MYFFNSENIEVINDNDEKNKKEIIASYLKKKKDLNFFEDKNLKKVFFDENKKSQKGNFYNENYQFYLYKCLNIYFTEKYLISKNFLKNFSKKGLDQKKIYDFLKLNVKVLKLKIDNSKIDDLLKIYIYSSCEFFKLIYQTDYEDFKK